MSKAKDKAGTVFLVVILISGFLIFVYPYVSNFLATRRGLEKVEQYEKMTSSLSDQQKADEWERAETYNEHLRGDPVRDPFVPGSGMALPEDYTGVLNIDGVMAYVEIPEIDVKLPVYHGVDVDTLKRGVGHIESTALPIGGLGTHAILTGHTGLPQAKLFTDLDELSEGSIFYIHVLGELLVYEVDQIKVIEPEDLSDLVAYDDKDYITLLTCTPYGLNTHRLLVRGERSYSFSQRVNIRELDTLTIVLFILCYGISVGILLYLLVKYYRLWRRRYIQVPTAEEIIGAADISHTDSDNSDDGADSA